MKQEIKNIIFDFGGVIINIDPQLTLNEFHRLGLTDFSAEKSAKFIDEILNPFETGKITAAQFRAGIMSMLDPGVTESMVDDAWNLTIMDIPPARIELLKSLQRHYRLFLLSNTNSIHFDRYIPDFQANFGFEFESLFERTYWSFKEGLRKPQTEFFRKVLDENILVAGETLFIDDTLMHIEAAKNLVIKTIHLNEGLQIMDLFRENALKDSYL